MNKQGRVYILSNAHHTTLYTGVTSNLYQRVQQHRTHLYPNSFTAKYNCTRLVYYSAFINMLDAITEEKRIKGGSRMDKVKLISDQNPQWRDLWEDLVG